MSTFNNSNNKNTTIKTVNAINTKKTVNTLKVAQATNGINCPFNGDSKGAPPVATLHSQQLPTAHVRSCR
ncbi:MAG: hypothetical protein EXS17_05745 [Phycisphaerales bacterium]|nr:hypothetical protein [Phycisphaerales bacterium]